MKKLRTHFDLIILGAGQIATAIVKANRNLTICVLSRNTKKISRVSGVVGIDWEIGTGEPPTNICASTVINCMLPRTKKQARAAIDNAMKYIVDKRAYVHLSSIAVNAYHHLYPKHLNFSGDWYIRIKKYELKYLQNNYPGARIAYPGIVCGGNTVWENTLGTMRLAKTIESGSELEVPAPITNLNDLGAVLLNYAIADGSSHSLFEPQKEQYANLSWQDTIGKRQYLISRRYIFFPSYWKEFLMILLTSSLTPDFVWSVIGAALNLKTKKKSPENRRIDKQYIRAVAMTNFYMTCYYD